MSPGDRVVVIKGARQGEHGTLLRICLPGLFDRDRTHLIQFDCENGEGLTLWCQPHGLRLADPIEALGKLA